MFHFHFVHRPLNNKHGKASKPNLAVVILCLIVVIETFLLLRAYSPKYRAELKPKPAVKIAAPKIAVPRVPEQPKTEQPKTEQPQTEQTKVEKLPVAEPVKAKGRTPYPSVGKIALIIDDSGYSRRDCEHLAAIDAPVTIAILPQLPYSSQTAQCAFKLDKEVMLHLPLEPHVMREKYPNAYFIKTNMPAAKIVERFREAVLSVPHAAGVNNHEGSKATEDSRVMKVIFKELAKQDLFFVDSRVTSHSVCPGLAEEINLPFAGRDIFLDNKNERGAIEQQYRDLALKARQRGTAIGIGHARELSWAVMKEQVKKLQSQGFEFVTVQEIINSQGH